MNGPKCEMAFELNGTEGAVRWNFERMNDIDIQFRRADEAEDGYSHHLYGGPGPSLPRQL